MAAAIRRSAPGTSSKRARRTRTEESVAGEVTARSLTRGLGRCQRARANGLLAGGMNFIQKPFAPEALARKVREVLDV